VKLLQQPEDGVRPLIHGINNAKSSIDLLIFRFDQPEIERALAEAVSRGVSVQALIAHLNGSGEDSLRKLEMRLLAAGITVARTADGFARYHAKLMIVDRAELYLLAFNFTRLDINRSRSFGIIVDEPKVVREAVKLFEADMKRQPYEPSLATFVVSPENSRQELSAFIEGAKKELLIYDPKVSDSVMVRLLEARAKDGVDVRIIGQTSRSASRLVSRALASPRLHARVMVRDREAAFIGSQSLREIELDRRREAGIILHESAIVNRIAKTFEEDWDLSEQVKPIEQRKRDPAPASKVAKKVAKAVVRELPPVAPVLEGTIKDMVGDTPELQLDPEQLEETVRDAVKDAVKEAVEEMVEDAAEAKDAKRDQRLTA